MRKFLGQQERMRGCHASSESESLAVLRRGCICPTIRILFGLHQELDPIQIHRAMTNGPGYSNRLVASGRDKFNLNFRSHPQIRHPKQAHPDIAQIDAKRIYVGRAREYLDRSIQQLSPSPPPVVDVLLVNHLRETAEYKVSR